MNKPVLSITIPTYNRVVHLKPTVESMIAQIESEQLHNEVEIVISDNCSDDDTQTYVESLIGLSACRIIYSRNPENIGVIRNILRLVELSNGQYWMFYGDDDAIPEGGLIRLVNAFKANDSYAAFMFRWSDHLNTYCKDLKDGQDFNIEQLAQNFFYYIGNAGIFGVNTELAKRAVREHRDKLENTCWPQTMILFLAMHYSESRKIIFKNIVSALPPAVSVLRGNSYYLFETGLYALLRTALYIETITKTPFLSFAFASVDGVQNFESYKEYILEHYYFTDTPKQKADLIAALKEAHHTIPSPYDRQIGILYRLIIRYPRIVSVYELYKAYVRRTKKMNLRATWFTRMKILSPRGFKVYMDQKLAERKAAIQSKKQIEVDSSSGYF